MGRLSTLGWFVGAWLRNAAARVRAAAQARTLADPSGQDIVEYAGMLAIIALVVAAILILNIPSVIANAIGDAVHSILGGGHKSASH